MGTPAQSSHKPRDLEPPRRTREGSSHPRMTLSPSCGSCSLAALSSLPPDPGLCPVGRCLSGGRLAQWLWSQTLKS